MKKALWILGGLLMCDGLFLSYYHIFRRAYYFPDRYEDAFAATAYALLFGLPVLGAFAALLFMHIKRLKRHD
jgi:hypothetical protein